jgi:hypothetical protein
MVHDVEYRFLGDQGIPSFFKFTHPVSSSLNKSNSMILKTYLSGPVMFSNFMRSVTDVLNDLVGEKADMGAEADEGRFLVWSTWHDAETLGYDAAPKEKTQLQGRLARRAMIDMSEVLGSNVVLSFSLPGSRGGRAAEVAIALAVGIPVFLVGEPMSIFDHHPNVFSCSWHELFHWGSKQMDGIYSEELGWLEPKGDSEEAKAEHYRKIHNLISSNIPQAMMVLTDQMARELPPNPF